MTKELVKKEKLPIKRDEEGTAIMEFKEGVHFVVNGDFQITATGEVSIVSPTVISLDCALLFLNSRMARQIRNVKKEMRAEFVEMLGGFPELTPAQLEYVKHAKQKMKNLLHLSEDDMCHIKTESKEEDDDG